VQIIVDGVGHRAGEQEHVRRHLEPPPVLLVLMQPFELLAEVADDLVERGKRVQAPRIAAIEAVLGVQQSRRKG